MAPFVSPIRPTLMNSVGSLKKLTSSQIPTSAKRPRPISEVTLDFRSRSSVVVSAAGAMRERT